MASVWGAAVLLIGLFFLANWAAGIWSGSGQAGDFLIGIIALVAGFALLTGPSRAEAKPFEAKAQKTENANYTTEKIERVQVESGNNVEKRTETTIKKEEQRTGETK